MSIFSEIHCDLAREGPGDNASTRRSLSLMAELGSNPRILDIGCGPGMQTLELARATGGAITALDIHRPFLDELARRARDAGVDDRVFPVQGSMSELRFDAESFDAIWSEGAVYIIGFERGLTLWRPLLKARGYLAVSELCWLVDDDAPAEAKDFWRDAYPDMSTIGARLKTVEDCGFANVAHFVLPQSAWWDGYYTPIERKLPMLREKYRSDPAKLREVDESQREIDLYRRYSAFYGYVFFIARKAEA